MLFVWFVKFDVFLVWLILLLKHMLPCKGFWFCIILLVCVMQELSNAHGKLP